MSPARVRFAGLGTRVAVRTFALFCLCAIVPIVISAIVADRVVRTKLRADAASHLESTSKSYGLLVFARLQQTDEALTELATLALKDRLALDDIRSFSSTHFKVVDVVAALPCRSGAASFVIVAGHGSSAHRDRGKRTAQTADHCRSHSSYLWNADAVYLDAMRICVYGPNARALQCVGDAVIHPANALTIAR